MRQPIPKLVVALIAVTLLVVPASAELLSKTYHFKSGVVLDVGATASDGLRIDAIRFDLPKTAAGGFLGTGGMVQATVAVSNTSPVGQKVGLAIALFDEKGRLVGVASGGSQVSSLKPERQKLFTLVFDNVNANAFHAATFQVTVESRR